MTSVFPSSPASESQSSLPEPDVERRSTERLALESKDASEGAPARGDSAPAPGAAAPGRSPGTARRPPGTMHAPKTLPIRPMRTHEGIEENLRFLIIEVEKQLQRTGDYLVRPNKAAVAKIIDGDDYIDNLKAIIQNKSFAAAAEGAPGAHESVALLRTFEVVASNLERIADFCEKVIAQVGFIDRPQVYAQYDFSEFLLEVLGGVGLIEQAVFKRDVQVALGICRAELTLDQMYAKVFKRVLGELRSTRNDDAQSLVTVLFIAHYMERMGDALLNIGEAILSGHLGERIKIGQLRALEDSLELTNSSFHLGHLSMKAMGETKSGARVNSLSTLEQKGSGAPNRSVIFKEGKTKKLIEERDSIGRWEQLMPGLAPQIYSFHDGGEDAAILFEYVAGGTFESVLLEKPWREVARALTCIQRKLVEVWSCSHVDSPVAPRFLHQLAARFDDVLAVHPEFRHSNARIGQKEIASFSSLIDRLQSYDDALTAPFSVFIHGDFNVDNVIYDPSGDSVRFIDLHRSRMMDYVQDVSVFLVSHFRLQFLETPVRRRINSAILRFFEFAKQHAERIGDTTFHQRLALGVARSLTTSTRYVLDPQLARTMFLRSRYILERVAELYERGRAQDFQLPPRVLVD
jgi:phosphate uptake regulator/Ser/Thr protein kinase RdoA (MazF antagonist)